MIMVGELAKKEKGMTGQKNLPLRIIVVVILLAFLGLTGIVLLHVQIGKISVLYKDTVDNEYVNLSNMNNISKALYRHQVLVYSHMQSTDPNEKNEIRQKANEVKKQLEGLMSDFSISMSGSTFESEYHDIYSGARTYLKDVEKIFDFSEKGEDETADYFMNMAVSDGVRTVNDRTLELDKKIMESLATSKIRLYRKIMVERVATILIVLFVLMATVIAIRLCIRTSDEMISVDSLTSVYNYDKLLRFAKQKAKKGRLIDYCLINVNIKDFKYINQRSGAMTGDQVLYKYALALREMLSNEEMLVRSGGDNFIFFIKKTNKDQVLEALKKVTIKLIVDGQEQELNIDSRCGIYLIEGSDTVEEAISKSSIALNVTKEPHSDPQVLFDMSMLSKMMEEKDVLSLARQAMDNEEFQVFYQPKADMMTGRLSGAEALVRWVKDGEIKMPTQFIPIMEKDGCITELDFYVFEHVCQDLISWKNKGYELVPISSNFSKLHLINKDFSQRIIDIVNKYGVDPKYLEAELTESSGYENREAFLNFIEGMKEFGIRISMDDFGTGYSSLSMLQDMEMDVIKLDKSFIDPFLNADNTNGKSSTMLSHVINMVNDMDKTVICEGVETASQVDFLVSSGCKYAQGYYYDKPLRREEFEQRLANPNYNLNKKDNE